MNIRMIFKVLVAVVTMTVAGVQARVLPPTLTLFEGESKVIDAPDAVRLSVGKADMVGSTLLKSGEMVLTANTTGETNLQVWFADGSRESLPISIVPSNGWRDVNEIRAMLGDIPGIKITTVGRRVVVDGNIDARDLERVNTVKERYDDMLVLARAITPYEQKMIYFDVQVAEFDRSKTEELGINWQKSFSGPSLHYANNWKASGAMIPKWQADDKSEYGYHTGSRGVLFGVATDITSMIDLLEQTGSAVMLSSPRLSARSGGKATLTVGGEVPVITSSLSGSSVEYKDYGVILGVEPKLDMHNNITAKVNVSISQLDLAQAVDGQPAFKKRETKNDIKLRPGETLVLSGLITHQQQKTLKKVKWLADIPILGNLFKSKSFDGGNTEMVIFLTPHVLNDLSSGPNKKMLDRVDTYMDEHKKFMQDSLLD